MDSKLKTLKKINAQQKVVKNKKIMTENSSLNKEIGEMKVVMENL